MKYLKLIYLNLFILITIVFGYDISKANIRTSNGLACNEPCCIKKGHNSFLYRCSMKHLNFHYECELMCPIAGGEGYSIIPCKNYWYFLGTVCIFDSNYHIIQNSTCNDASTLDALRPNVDCSTPCPLHPENDLPFDCGYSSSGQWYKYDL